MIICTLLPPATTQGPHEFFYAKSLPSLRSPRTPMESWAFLSPTAMSRLVALNIVLTLALILLGSGVHIQEQSLACPDWPLCYGKVLPHLATNPKWLAVAHRLLAAIVGILTLAMAFFLHGQRKHFNPHSLRWAWWASALVVLQGLLGALTVKYQLPTLISTAHLAFSAVFLCSLRGLQLSLIPPPPQQATSATSFNPRTIDWALAMVLTIGGQIVLGGLVRHSGAAQACGLGPDNALLCYDQIAQAHSLWPFLPLAKWHLAHRLLALFTTALVVLGSWRIIASLSPQLAGRSKLIRACRNLIFAVACQVLIGLWSVARELAPIPRLLHLLVAMGVLLTGFELYYQLRARGNRLGASPPSVLSDLAELTKPRLTALVVLTAVVGLLLAPDAINFLAGARAIIAIAILVAGACALNCYLERDLDKKMERTQNRSLPSGRLSPRLVQGLASLLVLAGIALLASVNLLTAALGLVAAALYLYAYTPLKPKSTLSLFVGAVPGAMPPVMGWSAVTASIDSLPLILFGIVFTWQIPHFIAIALYREEDYQRAQIKIIPLEHGHRSARIQIFAYTCLLVAVSLLPYFLALVSRGYLYCSLTLSLALGLYALRGVISPRDGWDEKLWARKYFWGTIAYLPLLLSLLLTFNVSL